MGWKCFIPQGTCGKIWRYLWLPRLAEKVSTAGFWWVEARDAANHSIVFRTASQQRIIWSKVSIVLRLNNFGKVYGLNCLNMIKEFLHPCGYLPFLWAKSEWQRWLVTLRIELSLESSYQARDNISQPPLPLGSAL